MFVNHLENRDLPFGLTLWHFGKIIKKKLLVSDGIEPIHHLCYSSAAFSQLQIAILKALPGLLW